MAEQNAIAVAIGDMTTADVAQVIHRYTTFKSRLGRLLHPIEITDAWYAQDCPPRLNLTGIPFTIRIRWRLACVLRGVRP